MAAVRVTVPSLSTLKQQGEKIACLTCYDASFARMLDAAGVDVLLVGDSLGMVVQGQATTLPVTLEQMVYHTACVSRGRQRALVVADMPFLSYTTPDQARASAARLMQEGGADMVKLEGGAAVVDSVRFLAEFGVPVCAHLGLLPQSVLRLGGYKVQGRDHAGAERIRHAALALQDAGAGLLVLECVPVHLAQEISNTLSIPVIGIGAGGFCDGQVLVLYDVLGITMGRVPRFAKSFLPGHADLPAAVGAYVGAVKDGSFPSSEHLFH
jgi:3-methyl-2-oxobutanoate hydroxymethyltransferase